MFSAGAFAIALACASPCSAQSSKAAPSIDDLNKMVQNLGYSTTKAGGSVLISVTGKKEYSVGIGISDDGTQVFGFTKLFEVPDDKLAKMPALDMLSFNDDNVDYFSVHKTDAKWHTMLNFQRAIGSINPQVMRVAIEQLVKDADSTINLSDPGEWK